MEADKLIIKNFEELSHQELYRVLKLRVDVFVVEQECAYPELDNQDQDAKHLLLYRDEALIGYARVLFEKGGLHIGRIVVNPDFRNQSIGKKLLEAAMQFCDNEHPGEKLHLSAQAHLENYYKRFGFETTSEPYDWDGIMHVDMEKV